MKLGIYTFLFCFLSITQLYGQMDSLSKAEEMPSIQTDRPDQTECPYIVPTHCIQLEAGSFVQWNKSNLQDRVFPTLLAKYGLSKNFEFRLILEYGDQIIFGSRSKAEMQPLGLGCKIKIAEEKKIMPEISLISHVHLPVFSENQNNFIILPDFRFTLAKGLSERINVGVNLGGQWDYSDSVLVFSPIYTAVMGFSISDKFGSYIEFFGSFPQKEAAEHNFDLGFTYLITNNLQADISAGVGIGKNNPMLGFASIGLSYRTPRLFKKNK